MTHRIRKQPLSLCFVAILAVTLRQSCAATDAPPTAAPPTPTGQPERGYYNITNGNGTTCLMAYMGLQINVNVSSGTLNKAVWKVQNLQPNRTNSSGSCDSESSTLRLTDEQNKINLTFVFSMNATTNKYRLSEVSLSASWPDVKNPFSASNRSLDYLHGTAGRSYMCREQQNLPVTVNFSLNTFQLQVQPFNLTGDQFGTAEECQLDEDNMLIPIIVGAALAGLVLVVLVAYLIGRKRSHAGYQTI
ncbi:hypothetical protein DPEC_G00051410 [Dallia pectoralis]|uniref:Uncharacterized protein n=1 Tax=Dallia pectoralis TaxID=75939 RepID=A0ACC2HBX9_DALPE|nr:hypothetical protein DPEC_G00051410 [Dallia pectoralis]